VINQLIPTVYDTARTIRILGEDEATKVQRINDPNDPESMDINRGRYDVVVETGPSYSTAASRPPNPCWRSSRRSPAAAQVPGDLIAKLAGLADGRRDRRAAEEDPAARHGRRQGRRPDARAAAGQGQQQMQAAQQQQQMQQRGMQLEMDEREAKVAMSEAKAPPPQQPRPSSRSRTRSNWPRRRCARPRLKPTRPSGTPSARAPA
jgi:hypothetical protein